MSTPPSTPPYTPSTPEKETSMDTTDRSGRHPVNIGHLVMGLAFVGLVGVWALVQGDVVHGADIRWLLPVPWVLAGIAGLLATTLTNRDRWGTRQTGWVGTTPTSYDDTTTIPQHDPTHEENR
ncbi:hypothetical protein H5V45_16090 [Nocardioides sp. KIGAM211]|uniref:Uncharacterized protein n=1 Tax=Nocardioides luti TaxID=2761101 RepID=A0A7X0RKN1_9ACTN|nr:hypothetical protein [Nocardioides luti]MBB6628849.1 hypothetical protein [Nocardioides luti]